MPYTVPTLSDFQARYPELAEVADPVVNALLLLASTFVDEGWLESDYQPAILSLAAHLVALEKERIDAEARSGVIPGGGSSSGSSGSGATYVRSISFGDRSISYGMDSTTTKTSQSAGGITGGKDTILSGLSTTIYGQIYRMLLVRNAQIVMVV